MKEKDVGEFDPSPAPTNVSSEGENGDETLNLDLLLPPKVASNSSASNPPKAPPPRTITSGSPTHSRALSFPFDEDVLLILPG